MSDVGSDRYRNTQGFLTKNVKEIFRDLNFLSEVTGCRKTQVSDHTGSTVHVYLTKILYIRTSFKVWFIQNSGLFMVWSRQVSR